MFAYFLAVTFPFRRTLVLIVVFSQCLHRAAIALPFGTITKHGCQGGITKIRVFELFPVSDE